MMARQLRALEWVEWPSWAVRHRNFLATGSVPGARVTIRCAVGFGTGRDEIDALVRARPRLAVVDDPFEERDDHAAR